MNKDALINRYRPQQWSEVVGNTALVKSLQASVDTRNSHGYILSGIKGVGKTTTARIISNALGCNNPFEQDGARSNGVDDMRYLLEMLRFRPLFEGQIHVFLLDEAHMLSRQAWTAILKSVEEPPDWVYWIFCTTDPSKLPDTVRSRCVHAQFKPVNKDDLFDLLIRICDAEKFATPDDVVDLCVNEAQGSPRQAIANLALTFSASDRNEAAPLLEAPASEAEVIDLIKALLNGAGWLVLKPILNRLSETNAETIRQAIRAYLTKVILNTDKVERISGLFALLELFSEPMYSNDLTPIVLAVGRHLFAEKQ